MIFDAAGLFRLLGDSARLRMLRLLERERLNVSELTGILGMAQSGVSRHLKLLKEAGLLKEQRNGGWAYYGVDLSESPEGVRRLWPLLQDQLLSLEGAREDDARLQEALRQRQEDFRTESDRALPPGRSWAAWARTLSYLAPAIIVGDLGCGEGYLTLEVARWARTVIAVDHSAEMLRHAKKLAAKHGVRSIRWKRGKLEKLPLENDSLDAALMAQALHCVVDPPAVLREAHRALRPGGRLLVQELRTHTEDWVRERFGDVWLGFDEKRLAAMIRDAGFTDVRIEVGAKRRGDPFVILIGCGRKS